LIVRGFWSDAPAAAAAALIVALVYGVVWSLFEFWIPLLKGHFVVW